MTQELKGSFEFLKDVVVFGAVIFCVLLQLLFTAVDHDLAKKRAYEVVSRADVYSAEEREQALRVLDDPGLCPEDAVLFELQSPEARRILARKLGGQVTEKELLRRLPTAASPWRVNQLALFLHLYSWIVELTVLLALSQTLQRPQVRQWVFERLRQARWFLPVTATLLGGPLLRWADLFRGPGQPAWPGQLLAAAVAVAAAVVLLWRVRSRLRPEQVTDLGVYILMMSLFVKLAAILASPDTVYGFFSTPQMSGVRLASWFILACGPLLLVEKWVRNARSAPSDNSPL